MSKNLTSKADLWFEFVDENGICGLCGNNGVIDTTNHVKTPMGKKAGIKAFCICPNGRTMKKQVVGRKWEMEYDRNF